MNCGSLYCSNQPGSFHVLLCADVHMCICEERLWWWDMLLCCCGVGAPLGLSVLVCWFPAAQRFAGPQGDTGGTYDWAMQSWASRSYRSATDTSLWRPSVSSLSAHSSARQQTWRRAWCSSPQLKASDPSHFRAGNCRAGAHVATRAKWTFLHSFLSKALCWHNNLPPTSTYYVWITL